MKKLFMKKTTLLVSILILFMLGQLLGNFTIRYLFQRYQMKELEPQAVQMAKDYVSGNELHWNDGRIVELYDTNGNVLEPKTSNVKPIGVDLTSVVSKYLAQIVTSSQTISGIETIDGVPSISLVIGVPIVKDDAVIGALFLMMPANSFQATLNGFTLVFSITLVIGSCLIGLFFWQYYKQAKELEKTRRDYVANISHELKSPIASIKALTETLTDGLVKDNDTQQRYYLIILSESNRLEHLVQDILQLSRLQSSKVDFSKKVIPARIILEPVCQKYETLCDEMGLKFCVKCDINQLPDLCTNQERITQLIGIFLDNAVKFVGEDGEITLNANVSHRKIEISIQDNGIGIARDILPHIFERFYKEEKAHNTKGSGLGLAIAKEVAMGLEEEIHVESEANKGSIFSFTIHTAQ